MESRIGTSRAAASASARGVHCCQCTGLSACWRKYGLVASPSVFAAAGSAVLSAGSWRPRRPVRRPGGLVGALTDRVGALVGGLIGLGVLRVECLRDLLEVPVHRSQQQQGRDQQKNDDQQPHRAGLAEVGPVVVGGGVSELPEEIVVPPSSSIPEKRSPSGSWAGPRERANSNSSVGQSRCCH